MEDTILGDPPDLYETGGERGKSGQGRENVYFCLPYFLFSYESLLSS